MKFSTFGKILGALGLVLVLSSPITLFITSGSTAITLAKAAVGIVLICAFFATNYKNLRQFGSGRSTFFYLSSALTVVALLGLLGAVNYIVAKKDKTWDLTNKKIFTLSPQTSSTLHGLKEHVLAIAFIDSSNPYYDTIRDLFQRYQREAPDQFSYTFKDPRKNPALSAKYELKEGQTTVVLTRGEGAKESHTALNVLSEQELTNALIKLNAVGEQKVYFVIGHHEWPLESASEASTAEGATGLSELKKSLVQEGYAPQALGLAGKDAVPKDAAVVILAGPKNEIAVPEVKLLRQYLEQGGRLLYFAETQGKVGAEMDKLLGDYGLKVDPGLVADDRLSDQTPYMILSVFYGDGEITRLLKQLQMNIEFPMTHGFTVLSQGTLDGVKTETAVQSSPYAWEELTPDDNPTRSDGEKQGQIPIVVTSTRSTATAKDKRFDEARLVAFGSSQILIDANWGHEANRNLVLNAVGWASNEVSKITIRPPDRDISTLDLSHAMMERIRFVSTDLLPLTLLGIGLAIWLTRRDK